jgi:hypothetical protein
MRVAVIGGGLFGCTAAIHLARAGHETHLFEAKSALMHGATAATFARLHRGYHYPRSPETGRESRQTEASFRAEYDEAVIDGGQQSYLVPALGSHVSASEFRAFLENEGLAFFQDGHRFSVVEPRIHIADLQSLVRRKVAEAGVTVHLGNRIKRGEAHRLRTRFDQVVIATYARLNEIEAGLAFEAEDYKFQVVEKPIVRLVPEMRNTSMVVIDGPFGCVDPLDRTGLHMLGHVTKTIHAENVGHRAEIPACLAALLDRGVITNCPFSRWRDVAGALARYIPEVDRAEYVGSSFTVRAVLAHKEATDERPTHVTRLDGQTLRVFSGKLGTAVRAAEEVVGMIGAAEKARAA